YQFVVVNKNFKANTEINKIVKQDFDAYKNDLIKLSASNSINQVFEKNGSISAANEVLYNFRNNRVFKGNFALIDLDGNTISTSFYEDNAEKLSNSFLTRLVKKNNNRHSIHGRFNHKFFQNGQESRFYFASLVTDDDQTVKGYLFYF